jgi:hypothetical protein
MAGGPSSVSNEHLPFLHLCSQEGGLRVSSFQVVPAVSYPNQEKHADRLTRNGTGSSGDDIPSPGNSIEQNRGTSPATVPKTALSDVPQITSTKFQRPACTSCRCWCGCVDIRIQAPEVCPAEPYLSNRVLAVSKVCVMPRMPTAEAVARLAALAPLPLASSAWCRETYGYMF